MSQKDQQRLEPFEGMRKKPLAECSREELIDRCERQGRAILRAWKREDELLNEILDLQRKERQAAEAAHHAAARQRMFVRFLERHLCGQGCGRRAGWLRSGEPICDECDEGLTDGLAAAAFEDAAYGRPN